MENWHSSSLTFTFIPTDSDSSRGNDTKTEWALFSYTFITNYCSFARTWMQIKAVNISHLDIFTALGKGKACSLALPALSFLHHLIVLIKHNFTTVTRTWTPLMHTINPIHSRILSTRSNSNYFSINIINVFRY